jgi:hypothetical protein
VIHHLSHAAGEDLFGRRSAKEDPGVWSPEVRRLVREGDATEIFVVGHLLIDDFLAFASTRARPNTLRAYAFDLKAFFTTIGKDPLEVRPADVFEFIKSQ